MQILIIGSSGNMGQRYSACLRLLGHSIIPYDIGTREPILSLMEQCDKALVCTPTYQHYNDVMMLINNGVDFLCEKPIYKDVETIEKILAKAKDREVTGHMVCNWKYVFDKPLEPGTCKIDYNCYNTGKDGTAWDCIQLIYLAKGKPDIKTDSPVFSCSINDKSVNRQMIDYSYLNMMKRWLSDHCDLWTLDDAIEATKSVYRYMGIPVVEVIEGEAT